EERFHTAFDHAAIGMALVSTDGQLLQTNRALGELLGRSETEIRGARLESLLHPEHAQIDRAALAQLDADEVPSIKLEKRLAHKSASRLWGLLCLSAVRGSDRRPTYYILQLHRIEERKRADGQVVTA
ncbi:MAG: PAS domain S-box protein, partial [Betaproteobacteria bacterium]|nr:PAS domain S-box protein [Betaproteobacteria bacterium]